LPSKARQPPALPSRYAQPAAPTIDSDVAAEPRSRLPAKSGRQHCCCTFSSLRHRPPATQRLRQSNYTNSIMMTKGSECVPPHPSPRRPRSLPQGKLRRREPPCSHGALSPCRKRRADLPPQGPWSSQFRSQLRRRQLATRPSRRNVSLRQQRHRSACRCARGTGMYRAVGVGSHCPQHILVRILAHFRQRCNSVGHRWWRLQLYQQCLEVLRDLLGDRLRTPPPIVPATAGVLHPGSLPHRQWLP
jgi:hypothetical protein